jgi:hypothetical protein
MKLELKDLAPYLPYGLKAIIRLREDSGLPINDECIVNVTCFEAAYLGSEYDEFKPILRPLSNYEDIDEILNEMNDYEIIMIEDNPDLIKRLSYDVIELMFKNHIDILGLIPKGLAIDINTL